MMLALTHAPSPRMQDCLRTHVACEPIDLELAARQHAAYGAALRRCGAEVRVLDVHRGSPDGAFVEDTAVVLDEVAILCPMGAKARRAEPAAIEPVLREYRPLVRIEPPAALEGGDVLRIGRRLLVGRSSRTNAAGIDALATIVVPLGYEVAPVPVLGCLHLKTACTALPDGRLLVNPAWLDVEALADYELVPVPSDEPFGANVAILGSTVLLAAEHPRTADLIRRLGFAVCPVELSEFAKAEGGVTCLSLLLAT